jgi:hypothetical protein
LKREQKDKLLNIFLNPFVLALPFTLLAVIMLNNRFEKFNTERVDKIMAPGGSKCLTYVDINADGNSELVYFFENSRGRAAAKVYMNNGAIVDQWNMNGVFLTNVSCTVIDVDEDGMKDIVMMYARNDSLFLAAFNPFDPDKLYRHDVFIDLIKMNTEPADYSFSEIIVSDINNDGYPELLFTMTAGFQLYPRRLYAYDLKRDTVKQSVYLAVETYLSEGLSVGDINGDGLVEIILNNFAQGNMRNVEKLEIHDNAAWIMILNNNLDFHTRPIPFNATPSSILMHKLLVDDVLKVLFLFNNHTITGDTSEIILFDPLSNEISGRLKVPDFRRMQIIKSKSDDQRVTFYNEFGEVFSTDHNLNLKPVGKIPAVALPLITSELDLDGCGKPELILTDREYMGYWVLRNDLSNAVKIQVPEEAGNPVKRVQLYQRAEQPNALALHIGNFIYIYNYQFNKLYWLKWPAFVLLHLIFTAVFWVVLYYSKKQINQRYQKDVQIAELKLKSIRNQMDPHFTFNAINTIASVFYKDDKKLAYSYFTKFSKLIRSTMLYSDQITRMLEDEINFTVEYLDIEKFRFRQKFEYIINVDEDVEMGTEVPRMIIQSYAETAISNGLMHRETGGILQINISENDDHLLIKVTDNGVGIEKSKEYNKEKAFKSMKVMAEFISLINELNRSKITVVMQDTFENGVVSGTEVLISIPFDIRYKLS